METKLTFKLIEKILDIIFFFIKEEKIEQKEKEHEEIKNDPVDYFNNRYSSGVHSDGSDPTETKRSDGE